MGLEPVRVNTQFKSIVTWKISHERDLAVGLYVCFKYHIGDLKQHNYNTSFVVKQIPRS